jgi:hypothetical protein
VTREEIEKRMDALAREFAKTQDREIAEEIFELARRLKETEHCEFHRTRSAPSFISCAPLTSSRLLY